MEQGVIPRSNLEESKRSKFALFFSIHIELKINGFEENHWIFWEDGRVECC